MRTFKDSKGRDWSLAMSIGQAKKLKEIGLDVLDGGESLTKLATNPYDTANALYVLCEEQAKKAEVTDEDFGQSLAGDVIDEATEALLSELVDFFPKRQREALRSLLARMTETQAAGERLATKKINSQEMNDMIQRQMTKAELEIDNMLAGESSGSALEQSATHRATLSP